MLIIRLMIIIFMGLDTCYHVIHPEIMYFCITHALPVTMFILILVNRSLWT